jgi:hypothetical protein
MGAMQSGSLRLVRVSSGDTPAVPRRFGAARRQERATARVERENRSAAGLSADDARAVFAAQVRRSLEGGPSAILRPEHRRRLMLLAGRLGLRTFDASLVIAIAQDQARARDADPVEIRLQLLPATKPSRAGRRLHWRIAAAVGGGLLLLAALVRWLVG